MTEAIVLTVPARHLTTGDHFNGMTLMSFTRVPGSYVKFQFVIPHTTHTMKVRVLEKDLDAVSFPLTKRGDDYSPNRRNAALGLPPVPPKPYVKPDAIAVYPVGTRIGDVEHFDRSIKVFFKCPEHEASAWCSKDPRSSSIFPQSDSTKDCGPVCKVSIYDYVLTHEYLPTRNG